MAAGNRVNAGQRQRTTRARAAVRQRPKLGQNFLVDRKAAARIVGALGDISDRTVLEIGPGRGALTEALAARAGRLVAVELDRVLAAQLRMKFAPQHTVEIIEGDIRSIDLANVLSRRPGPLSLMEPPNTVRARVVGNIPYFITSDILLHLFAFHEAIETVVIMVQREVAERIAAKPGGRDYGLLSATTQLYAKVEKLFTLPPGAFAPPPKVHSTVLRLTIAPRLAQLKVFEKDFIEFLKFSFAQKRKTLLNNLRGRYAEDAIRASLKAANVRSDVRAEALPLEKAASIFRRLAGSERMKG
jgi:16S rRNA (adenine1518-N6/adenine1519-N6)-dimethyltransferase